MEWIWQAVILSTLVILAAQPVYRKSTTAAVIWESVNRTIHVAILALLAFRGFSMLEDVHLGFNIRQTAATRLLIQFNDLPPVVVVASICLIAAFAILEVVIFHSLHQQEDRVLQAKGLSRWVSIITLLGFVTLVASLFAPILLQLAYEQAA